MPAVDPNEIRFQSDAFELANRFDRGASGLMRRSIEHARQRSGSIVLPQDVKAAVQELLADIQSAFESVCAGQLSEMEISEEEFIRLSALPFRRPDTVSEADDDL